MIDIQIILTTPKMFSGGPTPAIIACYSRPQATHGSAVYHYSADPFLRIS